MARIARVVAPGIPHHIIQRGNRRQITFFTDEDYQEYINLMSEWCAHYEVTIWSYCLMPNHVHLIAVPKTKEGLRKAIGEAHRRYTRRINFREEWRGHLWQGRFASFAMDENYLLAATRYIELNPVRANLVEKAEEYPWSSASAHITGHDDKLVQVAPLCERIENWKEFLYSGIKDTDIEIIRRHECTGRPLGKKSFLLKLEKELGCIFKKKKPGPQIKTKIIK